MGGSSSWANIAIAIATIALITIGGHHSRLLAIADNVDQQHHVGGEDGQRQQAEEKEEHHCFEQQYDNRVANFGSLHVVKRVAVIAPLGAFYVAHFIEPNGVDEDEAQQEGLKPFGGGDHRRNVARRTNGEPIVLYSSHSAHSLDWLQLLDQGRPLLASVLRLDSVLPDSSPANGAISPVLLVSACPARQSQPRALTAPFTVRPDHLGILPGYENDLLVNFRTFENGLLLFSMADQGDHLVVQLAAGRVQVFFDFGAHQRSTLIGGLALNDGRWHQLLWTHRFDTAELHVDGVRVNATEIVGLYRKLDLHAEVEIGGRPSEEFAEDQQAVPSADFVVQNAFHGCIARMELNGMDLLDASPVALKACQMPRPQLVSLGPSSSLQIPYSFLPFALDFHVLPRPGPLLTILDPANVSLLLVRIEPEGQISVGLALAGHTPKVVRLEPPGWHSLAIKLRADSLDLELNGATVFWVQGSMARRIGSTMHAFLLSAMGCYRSATIGLEQGIHVGTEFAKDECPLVQRCSPSPCQNEGKCAQTGFSSFQCECPPNYSGRFCQISKLPFSCEEHFFQLAQRGKMGRASERVLLDLDGGGPLRPFWVQCRRAKGKRRKEQMAGAQHQQQQLAAEVSTLLANDAPASGIVVRGVTEPGAIRRVLDYGLGTDELDRLMGSFGHCEQRMRFQCDGGQRLMTHGPGAENRPSSWYAGRNGQHGLQWGSAPLFTRLCSCAMNDTCKDQRQCNCDSGLAALDEGLNPHLQLLPILQLFIGGGTEPQAMANVSIGPLACSEQYVFDAVTFTDRNQRLLTSLSFPSAATFHASIQIRLARPQLTIFTYMSANQERWFQLFVRGGRLVGQIVYAGISHELVTDVGVNDNRWHSVGWEVDSQSMRLLVDRSAEKTVFTACVLPRATLLVIGSRTGKDRTGFAGQLRDFHVNGEEVNLGHLLAAQRNNNNVNGASSATVAGLQPGQWSACADAEGHLTCKNEGQCVELYDGFKCNCSRTPFAGDTCEDEVGMWVPLGSELKIAWQHPAQVSNCFRISVQSASAPVHLIRARALFAESHFNLSVDQNGHLSMQLFDGFFFAQNITLEDDRRQMVIADNQSKDIRFCANSTLFHLSVNEQPVLFLEGNFTFFSSLNVWHFLDRNFAGCVSRLMVGDAFPLKSPRDSRLAHSGRIRFGSCPHDNLEHRQTAASGKTKSSGGQQPLLLADEATDQGPTSADEIHVHSFVKSQRQLLFINTTIGSLCALCILVSLCAFIFYVQRRPDGVYKTHEKTYTLPPAMQRPFPPPRIVEPGLPPQQQNGAGRNNNAMAQQKFVESSPLKGNQQQQQNGAREYFC